MSLAGSVTSKHKPATFRLTAIVFAYHGGAGPHLFDLEDLEAAVSEALKSDGPNFIVAKIEETEYMPVAPVEPEFTLYRFRNTFVEPRQPGH